MRTYEDYQRHQMIELLKSIADEVGAEYDEVTPNYEDTQ